MTLSSGADGATWWAGSAGQASGCVVICARRRLIADAYGALLAAAGYRIVACVSAAVEAADLAASRDADVCLVEHSGGAVETAETVSLVVESLPETKVVVVSGIPDPACDSLLRRAGVSAIVYDAHSAETVIDIVAGVISEEVVDLRVVNAAISTPHPRRVTADDPAHAFVRFLTEREREVLSRMVQGQSTTYLAREMGITYATARTHIQHVLEKLGVHSKLQAVALAITNGLLPNPVTLRGGT